MPAPVPDLDDAPFWRAAAERRLVFQRCANCGAHRHPPAPMCPRCQSMRTDWNEAPARGVLFSYTVTHVAPHPALRDRTPYVVALVSFPSLDGVRLVTNIVATDPGLLRIGADVELVWEPLGADMHVPRFRIVAADIDSGVRK
jgi:uncharacterized OB-fold protein